MRTDQLIEARRASRDNARQRGLGTSDAAAPDTLQPPASRRLLGYVAANSIIRRIAMSTPFVRGLAWRFVAGEDLPAAVATVRALNERGITGTVNVVGTHIMTEAGAVAAADAVIAAIQGIQASGVRSHLSLKLTHVGLDVDEALCRRELIRILQHAVDAGVFVRIDMEEARYVDTTIAMFEDARDRFGRDRVGIVLQSYLRHRRGELARQIEAGSRIRLVRGGYWEGPEMVLASKSEIDEAFYADVDALVRGGVEPAIATHDERAIEIAIRAAAEAGISPDRFEFQTLLGVRPDVVDRLVRDGYAVRSYVPFGDQWYAYALGCIRRLPATFVAMKRARRTVRSRNKASRR